MRDPFRNFNTYKIDPITEIRNAGIVTQGEVYWVSNEADSDHRVRVDALGRSVVKTTIQNAINAVEDGQGDYVLVIPRDNGASRVLGTAIDVNKDRVKILSVGYNRALHGYNNVLEGYVAASGIDTELVNFTGAGVEFAGFEVRGTSGTHANGTITSLVRIGTASTGTPHQLYIHDTKVENTQAAAANGTAFIVNFVGDVPTGIEGVTFENCWLGNWNWAPTAVVNFGAGTAGPTYTKFVNTTFVIDAQATTDKFAVMGTGVTKYTEFDSCKFINVEAGTAPASALTGAVLVDNPVTMFNCYGVNLTAFGTDTELLVAPIQGGTAGAGMHNPGIGIIGTAPITAA